MEEWTEQRVKVARSRLSQTRSALVHLPVPDDIRKALATVDAYLEEREVALHRFVRVSADAALMLQDGRSRLFIAHITEQEAYQLRELLSQWLRELSMTEED